MHRELRWQGNPQWYSVKMSQCKELRPQKSLLGITTWSQRTFTLCKIKFPWIVDYHNIYHMFLNYREFQGQIASHEGCILFHAEKCWDPASFLQPFKQPYCMAPINLSWKISIKGRLWHQGLPPHDNKDKSHICYAKLTLYLRQQICCNQ